MEKVENKDICKECGGFCCKKCGCDYFVGDLEDSKIEYFESLLDTGRVSVIAALDFHYNANGTVGVIPTLYLRARNIDRGEIDLLSLKKTCASLTEDGCFYSLENRPSGGSTLIPVRNRECYSEVDTLEELKKWGRYQKILHRIVKRHTGMSVNQKLKEDAEAFFYDVMMGNFDGVKDEELLDVYQFLPDLGRAYPEELAKAKGRLKKSSPLLVKTRSN